MKEDQQELETPEKKRKVEDVQRIRRMVHESDKSKRLSHMQTRLRKRREEKRREKKRREERRRKEKRRVEKSDETRRDETRQESVVRVVYVVWPVVHKYMIFTFFLHVIVGFPQRVIFFLLLAAVSSTVSHVE